MSHAFDVNNAGRAVGFADVDALQSHDAGLLVAGRRTACTSWASPVPGNRPRHRARRLEGGWAAGATETFLSDEESLFHAFVWTGSGELLMLPGAEDAWDEIDSIAHGVSDMRDEVTGRSAADGAGRPTVWRCASLIGTRPARTSRDRADQGGRPCSSPRSRPRSVAVARQQPGRR